MNNLKLIKIFNIKILSFFLFIFINNAFAVQQSDKIKPEIFNINTDKFLKLKNEGKPIIARKWMVVTANQQASKVAAKILSKGGTAVDAMISAQLGYEDWFTIHQPLLPHQTVEEAIKEASVLMKTFESQ